MALSQPVVEPLVIAIGEALLLQSPFEVPIDFGHKGEVGIFLVHRRRRPWPESLGGYPPGAVKNLGQQQHRHVATHAVAFAGDRDQLVDTSCLQLGGGVIEL